MHNTIYIMIVFLLIISSAVVFSVSNAANKIGLEENIGNTSASYKGYLFLEIHTADIQGAGTDSDLYVTVIGTKTNLTRKALRSIGPSMNAFERNQVDICVIYTSVKFDKTDNIIQGVEFVNGGKWIGSAWKPSCIYFSAVDGAKNNDQWIKSGEPVFISFLKPDKAVCYA